MTFVNPSTPKNKLTPKDARISVRLTEEEEKAAKQLAEKHGMIYSEYVRRAVLGELVSKSEQLEMLEEIRDFVRKATELKK